MPTCTAVSGAQLYLYDLSAPPALISPALLQDGPIGRTRPRRPASERVAALIELERRDRADRSVERETRERQVTPQPPVDKEDVRVVERPGLYHDASSYEHGDGYRCATSCYSCNLSHAE